LGADKRKEETELGKRQKAVVERDRFGIEIRVDKDG
jgi:hypothetical protein